MKKKLFIVFGLVIVVLLSGFQNNGNTGTATIAQQVTYTAGVSQVFRNVGQSAHFLTFCLTGWTGTGIVLEESFDGTTNWTTIAFTSGPTSGNGCGVLQAGGYYQNVRSRAGTLGGTIVAFYSATSGPISFSATGVGSQGPRAPTACDKSATVDVANTATGLVITGFPDTGGEFRVCGYTISFNGATAAGSYQFVTANDNTCAGPVTVWPAFTTAATPQTVVMGSGLGQLFKPNGIVLCFTNNSGAIARVNVAWANVQGPF